MPATSPNHEPAPSATAAAPTARACRALGTALLATALAALLVVAGAIVGGVGREGTADPAARAAGGTPGGGTGDRVGALQRRVRALPGDHQAWAALGMAYLERARRGGDPSWYPRAERALRRSLGLRPGGATAAAGLSALAAARHDFRTALAWARRAVAADPRDATAHGASGDALAELGRYPEAFASWQRMVDLRPGLAAYARVSYAWELRGDPGRAVEAMRRALAAASDPAEAAWAAERLGELHRQAGAAAEAARAYRRALRLDPASRQARAGLARLAAADGQLDRAIGDLRRLVAEAPLPEHVALLREVAVAGGRPDLVAAQDALLGASVRLLRANGARVDLDGARLAADRALLDAELRRHRGAPAGAAPTADAVRRARAEWRQRPSIQAADALAWVLHARGRSAEARTYAARAVRLGTRDATLWFHKGMIELAAGDRAAARRDLARALAVDPGFSPVWSGVARRELRRLAAVRPARRPAAAITVSSIAP